MSLLTLTGAILIPVVVSLRRTLIRAYARLSNMGETVRVSDGENIRVSEEFYERLQASQRDDETLEETLRRIAGGPHPSEVAGLLTPEEAERMKEAIDRKKERNSSRFERAREAFCDEDE